MGFWMPREQRDPGYCAARVYDDRDFIGHQCFRKAVLSREIDGKSVPCCRQHDPVAEQNRTEVRRALMAAESVARVEQDIARDTDIRRREHRDAALEALARWKDPEVAAFAQAALDYDGRKKTR